MTNNRFLTVKEAVIILRVSRPTLYRHIKAGTIPSKTLGRRRLIPVWYIDNLEKADEKGTAA